MPVHDASSMKGQEQAKDTRTGGTIPIMSWEDSEVVRVSVAAAGEFSWGASPSGTNDTPSAGTNVALVTGAAYELLVQAGAASSGILLYAGVDPSFDAGEVGVGVADR